MKQSLVPTAPVPSSQPESSGVQSLDRALDLLEAFLQVGPEVGLTAIAAHARVNKTTAYRLLSTLERRGYIERTSDGRRYRLGVQAFLLGTYFQSQLDIRRAAIGELTRLSEQTGEAAFLCVREEDEALCIERVESKYVVNIFTLRVGGRQPLHWGAAPRALLTGLDEAELKDYAERTRLPASTPHSLTSLSALQADVAHTRKEGFVISYEDVTLGIAAVGAPVRDYSGRIVAAISLSGLAHRYDPVHLTALVDIVRCAAEDISRQMGYQAKKQAQE